MLGTSRVHFKLESWHEIMQYVNYAKRAIVNYAIREIMQYVDNPKLIKIPLPVVEEVKAHVSDKSSLVRTHKAAHVALQP
jgi:hypothetical protein